MLNFKVITACILAAVLLGVFILPVFAVTYSPGVTKGHYVKYGNFVGTGPGLEDFSNYDSQTLQITNVAGSKVTLLSTGQYKNGTATPGNGTTTVWDVAAGTENGAQKTQGPIIAANLNAGDPIPPPDTYMVNSTENRQYLGGTRSVDILSVSVATPDYNSSLTYVYDRSSGMLLEASSQTTVQAEPEPVTSEYSYAIIETNIFGSTNPSPSVSEFPILTLGAILLIGLVISSSVLFFLKKRNTFKNHNYTI